MIITGYFGLVCVRESTSTKKNQLRVTDTTPTTLPVETDYLIALVELLLNQGKSAIATDC